ncbi:MAG: type IX secretion system membrane protein PorP/SprF [Saprospiraceae bacterium]
MTNKLPLLGVVCLLCSLPFLHAQDPFFTHFYGNEALFNPALTGTRGALSLSLKSKQQWRSTADNGYQTTAVILEESMPCSIFDYGLSFLQDREGESFLQTQQIGGLLAAYVPLGRGNRSRRPADLRFGTGLHWGQQSVDFSRLVFIDQLHPKYGRVGPDQLPISSSFTPPNDGRSSWYFQPSVGVSLRGIALAKWKKPVFVSGGAAVHNLLPLTGGNNGEQGHSWSILGTGTPTIPRYSFHLEAEAVIKQYDNRSFLSLQPRLVAQTQRGLAYWEAGVDLGFTQLFTVGMSVHRARPHPDGPATNWAAMRLETGLFIGRGQRLDLGFGYSYNYSGLRNLIGSTFEVTATFSFATSPVCGLRGKPAGYDSSDALKCPTARGGRGRDKIYENIWYKTGTRQQQGTGAKE